ncbi:MAG: hypothetical protein HDT26_02295 [Subdoligranulum sp.]|nr:hypothetical protein [Subdoligranulum sp.]
MKRFVLRCTTLLCLAFFLTLTACAPKEDPATDPPVQSLPAEDTHTTLPFSVGRLYDIVWRSYSPGVNDGKAFYEVEMTDVDTTDRRILRIDYETRAQTPLCSLPGCMHESADCPAFLGGTDQDRFFLTVVEGQLYVLRVFWSGVAGEYSAALGQTSVWLEKVAMDGSGRQRLAELPASWVLDNGGMTVFPVTDGAALYGQYFDTSDGSTHGVRVALQTGEVTSFSFGLDDVEALVGAWDGQFILRRSNQMFLSASYPGVLTQEIGHLFESEFGGSSYGNNLVLYDPTAGTRTDLNAVYAQTGTSVIPYSLIIQQGKIYETKNDDLSGYPLLPQIVWQIDPATGAARILTEFALPTAGASRRTLYAHPIFPAGPDSEEPYLWGDYWQKQTEGFLLDVRDGSVLEIGLRYRDGSLDTFPVAQTDNGLWLVPVDSVYLQGQTRSVSRTVYALAAPETVISGEGEVYPIQMWDLPEETPAFRKT